MDTKESLGRKQRRQLGKLKHSSWYIAFLSCMFFFFPPVKKFALLPVKGFQKVFGIISYTVIKVIGYKFGLIDDFIVHKKLRGKGDAQKLFSHAEKELEDNNVDYMVLTSGNSRKASHKFYKKAGLTIIGVGVGIIAYKRLRKKK